MRSVTAGYAVYANDHRGHGRSISDQVALGSFGAAGWSAFTDQLVALSERIRDERPGLPLFLLGHSMGSFALQEVIIDHSDLYRGVVLSGSTALGVTAAGLGDSSGGEDLSAFNAGFENWTGYEWLSRDTAEVDKYVADPSAASHCHRRPSGPLRLGGLAGRGGDAVVNSGDGADPLAGGGQFMELLAQRYRDAGVQDVTLRLFTEARHEIFNETNRDEVTRYFVEWLKARG